MNTPDPKPAILTPKVAQMFIDHVAWNAPPHTFNKITDCIHSLRDGTAKVVPVRSEAEWRAEFEANLNPLHMRRAGSRYVWTHVCDQWGGYLAALRSLGLVAATRDA